MHDRVSELANEALFPERFVPEQMHGLIEAEHVARYQWASAWVVGRQVLDAGCGVGYGSLLLRAAGATHVIGVDIAEEAIDVAREHVSGGVDFICGDISEIPLADGSCDVVVCFEAIEHVQDQSRVLDELRRVLTPAGLLIISSPNREVYEEGNPHHTREYTPEELLIALRERFAKVRLKRQQAWLLSMICDDKVLGNAKLEGTLDVDLRKIARVDPGQETFTLALASDRELPTPRALALITDLDELSTWRARARSAEEHLARSEQAALDATKSYTAAHDAYASAHDAYTSAQRSYENALVALETVQRSNERHERELNRTSTLLAERNAALRLVAEDVAALRTQAAALEVRLTASNGSLAVLTSSKSWRLTAPLRALLRVGRRS